MNFVSVTGADADQASAAVLNVNCADQIAETTQLLRQDRTAGDAGRGCRQHRAAVAVRQGRMDHAAHRRRAWFPSATALTPKAQEGTTLATFISLTQNLSSTAIRVNMDNVFTIEADEKGSILISVAGATIAVNEKPDRIMQLIRDEQGRGY